HHASLVHDDLPIPPKATATRRAVSVQGGQTALDPQLPDQGSLAWLVAYQRYLARTRVPRRSLQEVGHHLDRRAPAGVRERTARLDGGWPDALSSPIEA